MTILVIATATGVRVFTLLCLNCRLGHFRFLNPNLAKRSTFKVTIDGKDVEEIKVNNVEDAKVPQV